MPRRRVVEQTRLRIVWSTLRRRYLVNWHIRDGGSEMFRPNRAIVRYRFQDHSHQWHDSAASRMWWKSYVRSDPYTKLHDPTWDLYLRPLRDPRYLQPLRAQLTGRHPGDAIITTGIAANTLTLHADRGGAISKPVSQLMVGLGFKRSRSRPRSVTTTRSRGPPLRRLRIPRHFRRASAASKTRVSSGRDFVIQPCIARHFDARTVWISPSGWKVATTS